MPTRPKRFTPNGQQTKSQAVKRYDKERGRLYDKKRGSSTKRGYDYRWQQFRAWYLQTNPLCRDCEEAGRLQGASEVHHKVKLSDDPEQKYDENNLVPLCKKCHSRRSGRGE